MYVDLTTLHCGVLEAPEVASLLAAEPSELAGVLRGVWHVENGVIGEVVVVRTFERLDDLLDDRRQQFLAPSPFGLGARVRRFTMNAHETFDFAEVLPPGRHGDVWEMRVYDLTLGGLAPTLAGWREVLPGRMLRSPLAIGMSALDGRPSITHVYPITGADERMSLRAGLFRDGLWPPTNGPESIEHGTSSILLPAPGSPWH